MYAKQTVPVDPKLDQEFDKAFAQIQEQVDLSQADQLYPTRSNAVYTSSVVLWKQQSKNCSIPIVLFF